MPVYLCSDNRSLVKNKNKQTKKTDLTSVLDKKEKLVSKRKKFFEAFPFKITRNFIPEELIQMEERYLAVMFLSVSAHVIKDNFLGIALVVSH